MDGPGVHPDEARELLLNGVSAELVVMLGRWKSTAFMSHLSKVERARLEEEEEGDEDKEEVLSDDEEQKGAKRTGKWWDCLRRKKVVPDDAVKAELLYSLTWSQPVTHASPPTPRSGHSMVAFGSLIYIFGGHDGQQAFNSLYVLDVGTMTWSQRETEGAVPSPRQRHSAVALPNDVMMVFGGITGGKGGGSDVYLLDTLSLSWEVAPTVGNRPTPRWGHSATLMGNRVFVIGGHTGAKALDEVWEIDIVSWEWKLLQYPQMTGAVPSSGSRHTTTGIADADKLVLLGASATNTFKEVFEFDATFARWYQRDTTGQTPPSRSRHTTALVDNNLFVFGGVGSGRALNDLNVYNSQLLRWNEPATGGRAPSPRMDHTSVVITDEAGTRVFVFGGYDGHQPLNDLHVLLTLTWADALPSDVDKRAGHSLTVVGNKLFVIGGMVDGRATCEVHVFHMDSGHWATPTLTGLQPSAMVSHTANLLSSEIVCFGGGDGLAHGHGVVVVDTEHWSWDMPPTEGRMPRARYGHAACLEGTNLVIFGGFEVGKGYSQELGMLDTAKMSWSYPYVNGMCPEARVCHTMAIVGRSIYIFGGSNSDMIFGDMHVLDLDCMTWNQPRTTHSPLPRFLHTCVAVGRQLYFYGGMTSYSQCRRVPLVRRAEWLRHKEGWVLDDLHVLNLDTMHFDQPNIAGKGPGPRARHTSAVYGSKVLVFGGKGTRHHMVSLDTGITLLAAVEQESRHNRRNDEQGDRSSILQWLQQLQLQKYASEFFLAEIDWTSLLHLTDKDLVGMGITALGPRKKLLTAIANRKEAASSEANVSAVDLYRGRYRVEGMIPYSGGSKLKLATDMKTDRKVALKFVSSHTAFAHEVAMLTRLRSDFVVDLLQHYEDESGNAHCLVLELGSTSLAQYRLQRQVVGSERKSIMERLSRILEFMHTRSVMHGDVRSANLFQFGMVWKIANLEQARPFNAPIHTSITPFYCSPEVAKALQYSRAHTVLSHPSVDVWAVGVMLAEMFGVELFQATTQAEMLQRVTAFNEAEVNFEAISDPQARHLLAKVLRKSPMDRVNIACVLRHAFFAGGIDTEQQAAAFEFVQQSHTELGTKLTALQSELNKLKGKEEKFLQAEKRKLRKEEEDFAKRIAEVHGPDHGQ